MTPPTTGRADMERALQAALKIPQLNRTVHEFLFTEILTSAFHPSNPIPPKSLSISLPVSIDERMKPDPNSNFLLPCDAMLNNEDDAITTQTNCLFTPVQYTYPYMLGYAFYADNEEGSEGGKRKSKFMERENPFKSPCVGRFVFDLRDGDLLMLVYGGEPKCIGIHHINSVGAMKIHDLLAVSPVPYEWPYLPSTVLWKISSNVTSTSSSPINFNLPTSEYPVVGSCIPLLKNCLDDDGVMPDGGYHKGDDGLLKKSTECLMDALDGVFETTECRMDFMTKDLDVASSVAGLLQGIISFKRVDRHAQLCVRVREKFASLYYLDVLSVSADGFLLNRSTHDQRDEVYDERRGLGVVRNEDNDTGQGILGICNDGAVGLGTDDDEWMWSSPFSLNVYNEDAATVDKTSKNNSTSSTTSNDNTNIVFPTYSISPIISAQTQSQTLAPRPAAMHIDNNNGKEDDEEELRRRKEITEARKRRNRISAAKSNEKKKLQMEQLKKETEIEKRRLSLLEKRRLEIVEDNQRLRDAITTQFLSMNSK